MVALIVPEPYNEAEEFKKKIWQHFDELNELEVFHNQLIVVKFIRTKVSASIYAANSTQTEDKWQGKVGLVIKLGPSAFVDEPGFSFHGTKAAVGDWVIYRNTDGYDMDYKAEGAVEKINLRWIEDAQIKGRTTRPQAIW